jgi:hypothetical protein
MEGDRYIRTLPEHFFFEGLSQYESMGVGKNLWFLGNQNVLTS